MAGILRRRGFLRNFPPDPAGSFGAVPSPADAIGERWEKRKLNWGIRAFYYLGRNNKLGLMEGIIIISSPLNL